MRARLVSAPWLPGALVAALTVLTFLPSLENEFVNWDDDENFLFNPHYRGLGWTNLRWMLTTTHMGPYVPLAWVTLGLDYLLWGMNPLGYHLTSVVLHTINALLGYAVARCLLAAGFGAAAVEDRTLPWAAAATALFFSLHPLRVESVAWVTERRDLVMGLFSLLALLAYLRAWQRGSGGRLHAGWRWLAVALFALALLSKAAVAGLPIVLLLLDVYPLRRLARAGLPPRRAALRLLAEKAPFLAASAAVSALALAASGERGLLTSLATLGIGARLAITGYSLAFYLWKTLVPWPLSPLYPLALPVQPWSATFLLPSLTVALITAGVIALARRWPLGLLVWGSHVALLLPVAGLLHNGPQIAADRYTYAAGLVWAGPAGAGLLWVERARRDGRVSAVVERAVRGAAAALLVALAGLAVLQVGVWRDSVTLWRHAAWVEPASEAPVFYLGWALRDGGRLAEAREHFARSLDRVPPRLGALRARLVRELGVTEQRAGDHAEAARRFREALGLDPEEAVAAIRLGVALSAQGAAAEAERAFLAALPLVIGPRPAIWELRAAIAEVPGGLPEARGRLAFALAWRLQQRGALEEAGEHYRAAVALLPRHAEAWNNLGVTLALRRRPGEALEAFLQALRVAPGNPEACRNGRRAALTLGVAPAELGQCPPGRG